MSTKLSQEKIFIYFLLMIFVFTGCDQIKTKVKKFFTGTEPSGELSSLETKKETKKKEETPMGPNTLARIGNWSVTIDEFNERLKAVKEIAPNFDVNNVEAKKLILEELIRQQLFVEEAQKTGLAQSKDIKAAVEEFRRTLIVRELAQTIVKDIKVSDDELKAFYDQNKKDLKAGYDFRVSEIVVEDKDEAENILEAIKDGKDFADLARKNSIAASAIQGGDLGVLKEEPFPEMVNALLPLEEGEVSQVFEGPEGYYIIKLTEKTGGEQLEYQDIKEELRQKRLLIKQQEAILKYLEELKSKYTVDKNEDLLGT